MTQYDDQLRNRGQRGGWQGNNFTGDDRGQAYYYGRGGSDNPYYAGGTYQARDSQGDRDHEGGYQGDDYPARHGGYGRAGYQGDNFGPPRYRDQGRGYVSGQDQRRGYYGRSSQGPAYPEPDFRGAHNTGGHDAERGRGYGSYGGYSGNSEGYGDPNVGRGFGADRNDQRWSQEYSAGPHGSTGRHPDADYHQWRDKQISALDRDYDDWRKERYEKFSEDFDSWRSSRAKTANRASTEGTDVDSGLSAGQASGAADIKTPGKLDAK